MNEALLKAINIYLASVATIRLGGNTLPINDLNQAIVVMCNVYLGRL